MRLHFEFETETRYLEFYLDWEDTMPIPRIGEYITVPSNLEFPYENFRNQEFCIKGMRWENMNHVTVQINYKLDY